MRFILLLLSIIIVGCSSETPLRVPNELPEVVRDNVSFDVDFSGRLKADKKAPKGIFEPQVIGNRVYIASNRGYVRAYDIETGKTLWTTDLELDLSTGVAAFDGHLAVVGRDGEVIVLSTEGEKLWQFNLNKEVLAPPSLSKNRMVVQAIDGSVVAFHLKSGKVAWRFAEVIPNLTLRGTNRPFIFNDRVILAFSSGKLVALKLSDGQVFWQQVIQKPKGQNEFERLIDLDGRIAARENILFIPGYQGYLTAVEAYQGQVLWQKQHSSFQGSDFYIDRLYTVDESSHVQVLDFRNGEIQWQNEDYLYRDISQPLIIDDYIVFSDFEGYVHLMNRFDSKTNDRHKVGTAPVRLHVENGKIFALASNGRFKQLSIDKDEDQ